MVFFTVRALATLLQRGPTVIRFGLRQPVFLKSVAGPVAGKTAVKTLPKLSERITAITSAKLNRAGTRVVLDTAFDISGGDQIIANKIIGRTIAPISQGRIKNVTDAGEVIIDQIRALRPGGERPDFPLLALGLSTQFLPFVGSEVREAIVEQVFGAGTKLGQTASAVFKIASSIF